MRQLGKTFAAAMSPIAMAMAAASIAAAAPPAAAQSSNETLVQGYIRFMAYHEAGHMLMNQIQGINAKTAATDAIESAADDFATLLLIPDPSDENGVNEMMGAALAWLKAGPRYSEDDPHAPPLARAEQIICHIYGSDPQSFAGLAEVVQPEWECEQKYADMLDGLVAEYANHTDRTGVQIDVSYAAPTQGMERAAQFLRDSTILEDLAYDVGQDFKLIRPTKLMAMNCKAMGGDSGTFHYDSFSGAKPEQNYDRIVVCYELIDMWLKVDFDADQ